MEFDNRIYEFILDWPVPTVTSPWIEADDLRENLKSVKTLRDALTSASQLWHLVTDTGTFISEPPVFEFLVLLGLMGLLKFEDYAEENTGCALCALLRNGALDFSTTFLFCASFLLSHLESDENRHLLCDYEAEVSYSRSVLSLVLYQRLAGSSKQI
ncbi:MAG: hypothetical protein J0L72_10550 [Armatimonadetes bacterium]|nr:hypothetical protein [Armatimonadota bacterium]